MLKVGLIGFGGIAKAHRKAYANLEKLGKAQLVCAYDIDPEAFDRKIKINIDDGKADLEEHITFYTDLDEMLAKEEIDFLDLCVPTFLHSKIASDMLRRGYHVMCEKPMSLTTADCDEMLQASRESGKELMIGQCLRFYPAFDYIKAAIEENRYGKVLGGFFCRLSAPPIWGWENWFMSPERSGGCITDLHIHDVDIIRYLFGEPQAISCRASSSVCIHDTVHTAFFYDGAPITAIGDWTLTGTKFCADCRVEFEQATVAYEGGVLTVYPKDGSENKVIPLEKISGYQGELDYFCDVVTGRIKNEKNPATSAATTIRLIERMRQSANNGGETLPFASTLK